MAATAPGERYSPFKLALSCWAHANEASECWVRAIALEDEACVTRPLRREVIWPCREPRLPELRRLPVPVPPAAALLPELADAREEGRSWTHRHGADSVRR